MISNPKDECGSRSDSSLSQSNMLKTIEKNKSLMTDIEIAAFHRRIL